MELKFEHDVRENRWSTFVCFLVNNLHKYMRKSEQGIISRSMPVSYLKHILLFRILFNLKQALAIDKTMGERITRDFTSFLTVFQINQDDGSLMMEGWV